MKDKSKTKDKDSYLLRLLIAIDQLGNAIGGGNPDATVSARTGFFSNIEKTKLRLWWRCMEATIDFAFVPIDGPNHCLQAYHSDKDERHREGSDIARCVLGVGIILVCIPISILTRIYALVSKLF